MYAGKIVKLKSDSGLYFVWKHSGSFLEVTDVTAKTKVSCKVPLMSVERFLDLAPRPVRDLLKSRLSPEMFEAATYVVAREEKIKTSISEYDQSMKKTVVSGSTGLNTKTVFSALDPVEVYKLLNLPTFLLMASEKTLLSQIRAYKGDLELVIKDWPEYVKHAVRSYVHPVSLSDQIKGLDPDGSYDEISETKLKGILNTPEYMRTEREIKVLNFLLAMPDMEYNNLTKAWSAEAREDATNARRGRGTLRDAYVNVERKVA